MNKSKLEIINNEVSISKRELKNLRQEVLKIKAQLKSEIEDVKNLIVSIDSNAPKESMKNKGEDEMSFNMLPIGLISSCFKYKNGTPRQHSLCQTAKATLEINKTFFTNPQHSLYGLKEFSYIWILFVFHKNIPENSVKAKVHPPRLNGASMGVFSTRSPHRPCPIGLSLVKLEKIIGNKLYLSGVDLLDGTPVLDIKPYIPAYDIPEPYEKIIADHAQEKLSNDIKVYNGLHSASLENIIGNAGSKQIYETQKMQDKSIFNLVKENCSKNVESCELCKEKKFEENSCEPINSDEELSEVKSSVLQLLINPPNELNVIFTNRSEKDVEKFHSVTHTPSCEYCLHFLDSTSEAKRAIVEVLQNDPRSVYRRTKCADKLYFFEIDSMHITCWFDDTTAEIVKVKPTNTAKFHPSDLKK